MQAKSITIESLLNDVTSVPSLPMLYHRLDEIINHPRSSISDIAKILSEDQGLTARILKLANSPMFGYFAKIDTISQAVTVIGVQQVRDLALAVSVMGLFNGIPEELITMERFWQHSIACGLTSRILATSRRENNLERFFVAGILHDIGRLVLFIRIPDICLEIMEECRQYNAPFCQIEKQKLGFDHAEVGGELLKRWKLPPRVSEPVSYHHGGTPLIYPMESAILHLADVIAHAMEFGSSGDDTVPPFDTAAWDKLGYSKSILPSILTQVDKQCAEVLSILQGVNND